MAQPIVPAQPYYPQIDKEVSPKVSVHLQRIYPALNDHDQAINTLDAKVNSIASSLKLTVNGTTVTAPPASANAPTNSVTPVQAQNIAAQQASNAIATTLGPVNNQTATTYTSQSSDYGGIVTLNNASPVTVTLNPSVVGQWYAGFENLGAGTATLTPGTPASGIPGTINGVATLDLTQNQGALAFFDGTNWWAVTSPSISASAVTSLNGETGAVVLTSSGATITITEPTANTINLEAAAAGVSSLNTLTGALALTSTGGTVTITPSGTNINLEAVGGGGGGYIKGTVAVTISGAIGPFLGTGTVTGATVGMAAVACNPTTLPATPYSLTAVVTGANTVQVSVYDPVGGGGTFTFNFPVIVFP